MNNQVVFSTGININKGVQSHPRLDEELKQLHVLIKENASVAIVNHQGDYQTRTSRQTPYISQLLSHKLERYIEYFPSTIGKAAKKRATTMKPGEIVFFSNTRLYQEEQQNSHIFAHQLSALGNKLIIGGFCKLHRQNSSNSALKNFLPYTYSIGVQDELKHLCKLRSRLLENKKILFMLGGNKFEKLSFLNNISQLYAPSGIILGGILLNTLLNQLGYNTGVSKLHDGSIDEDILHLISLPSHLYVKNEHSDVRKCSINEVKKNEQIIDFELQRNTILDLTSHEKTGSFFAAGPLAQKGRTTAHLIFKTLEKSHIDGLFLGGDTITEIKTFSYTSSGGGASLKYFLDGYSDETKHLTR